MKNLVTLLCFYFVVLTNFAQQLDPIHYPPESEWQYIQTKQTDSLIQVMKFYFNANDTLFFREAVSQQVVKLALADIQRPTFYLGTKYYFAERFYGPNGANAKRTSKNEKLDRFYYYYLHAPELPINKTAPIQGITSISDTSAIVKTETIATSTTPTPPTSAPAANDNPAITNSFYSVIKPHILLKNGQVLRPEKVYFLSEGQIYFGQGVRQHIYKVDTAEIATMVGYEVGENLWLNSRIGYAFGGRLLRTAAFIVGWINTLSVMITIGDNTDAPFLSFLAGVPTGTFYVISYIEGTKRIQNKKRYKFAKYVQFAN